MERIWSKNSVTLFCNHIMTQLNILQRGRQKLNHYHVKYLCQNSVHMIGNPRLWIEIIVNVTGIGIGIKVNVTGVRIGIGIIELAKHWNRNWNRNFWATLKSESELESLANGIRIWIGIMDFGKSWNRNQPMWNRNHWSRKHIQLWQLRLTQKEITLRSSHRLYWIVLWESDILSVPAL